MWEGWDTGSIGGGRI